MRKYKYLSLFILSFAAGILFAWGCGGGGTSSASSPTTPAQIPTAVEGFDVDYGSGDVVIAGVLPSGGISGSLSKAATESCSPPTGVYSASAGAGVSEGVIDTTNCNYFVPAKSGYTHALFFVYPDRILAFLDKSTGSSVVPLISMDGASNSGTATFDKDRVPLSDNPPPYMDLGATTVNLANNTITTGDTADMAGKTGLTDDEIIQVASWGDSQTRFGSEDLFNNLGTDLVITYVYNPTQSLNDLLGGIEGDKTKIEFGGYAYFFEPPGGLKTVASATMTLPVDVTTKDSTTYTAGTSVESCPGGGNKVYGFFMTGIPCSPVDVPGTPPAGNFTVTVGNTIYTINVPVTQDIGETSREGINIIQVKGVYLVMPKLVVSGGNITGIEWKWVKKNSDGSWDEDLLASDVRKMVSAGRGGVYINMSIGSTSITLKLNEGYEGTSNADKAMGKKDLSSPILASSVDYLSISYTDHGGYNHDYTWSR